MDNTNSNFAIFGDCVSQGIVDDREHTRAIGFMNWCSIISNPIKNKMIIEMVDSITMSPYNIRNLKLDLQKTALDYLLEKKADYLLLDANDCRMELAKMQSADDYELYTISTAGGYYIRNFQRK